MACWFSHSSIMNPSSPLTRPSKRTSADIDDRVRDGSPISGLQQLTANWIQPVRVSHRQFGAELKKTISELARALRRFGLSNRPQLRVIE